MDAGWIPFPARLSPATILPPEKYSPPSPKVIKPIHSLWNQVIGFFFLCFAAAFFIWTYRYYRIYLHDPQSEQLWDLARVIATAVVGAMMTMFGVSAFLKARRISRS